MNFIWMGLCSHLHDRGYDMNVGEKKTERNPAGRTLMQLCSNERHRHYSIESSQES